MKKIFYWIIFLIIGINLVYLNYQVRNQMILINDLVHCDSTMWGSQVKLDVTIYEKMKPLYHKDTVNSNKIDSLFKLIK